MAGIQYLNHYRSKMAEDALRHTNLTLSEIAICCGYNYESYFIKVFTEKHGITPTEYRKIPR
ncbi:MAG: helix-turn-helix transcriptional regulator [Lachnospiraceae bacterium]|nr:helix-turn-helix transcriptional regulator [Lachnospiraceae bacterium]